jgi:predicted nucleic acid-binding protein
VILQHNLAIIDASGFVAAIDRSDPAHASVVSVIRRRDLRFVVPTLAIAEASYFIQNRFGSHVEATFIRSLATRIIDPPIQEDWPRIADLIEQYADFPLGTTDASIVALAERIGCRRIVTLDRRHFLAVRPAHASAFVLLPDA